MKGVQRKVVLMLSVLALVIASAVPAFAATTDGTVDFTPINSQVSSVTSGLSSQIPTYFGYALAVGGLVFAARLGWRFIKGLAKG